MKRWVAVGFSLDRKLTSARLSRKVGTYGSRFDHVMNITDSDEVDDELLGWLRESFLRGAPDPTLTDRCDGDPMAPDDIDLDVDDCQALEETAYLLRSPANARRLLDSLDQAQAGDANEHNLAD